MKIDVPLLAVLLTLLGVILGIAYQAWTFLDQRKRELRDKRFVIFHGLIRDLVEPTEGKTEIKLDRQVAIIFELRSFPEYGEVTGRILRAWRDHLSKLTGQEPQFARLITEIDLTMGYLTKQTGAKRP